MQFAYTILYVADVPATIAFYEQAFGLRRRFLDPEGQFGELDTGSTALAFSSLALMTSLGKSPQPANPAGPCCEVAFTTADVPTALRAGARSAATALRTRHLAAPGIRSEQEFAFDLHRHRVFLSARTAR